MDADVFDRLNMTRATSAQAVEAHWAVLAEQRASADVDDIAEPEWVAEHERLVKEASAAEAALLDAVRWSGPPAT